LSSGSSQVELNSNLAHADAHGAKIGDDDVRFNKLIMLMAGSKRDDSGLGGARRPKPEKYIFKNNTPCRGNLEVLRGECVTVGRRFPVVNVPGAYEFRWSIETRGDKSLQGE
jgi:hypothetical protein